MLPVGGTFTAVPEEFNRRSRDVEQLVLYAIPFSMGYLVSMQRVSTSLYGWCVSCMYACITFSYE